MSLLCLDSKKMMLADKKEFACYIATISSTVKYYWYAQLPIGSSMDMWINDTPGVSIYGPAAKKEDLYHITSSDQLYKEGFRFRVLTEDIAQDYYTAPTRTGYRDKSLDV